MGPMFFLTISVGIASSQPVMLLRVMCRMEWQMKASTVLMTNDRLRANMPDICLMLMLRLSLDRWVRAFFRSVTGYKMVQ